MAEGFVQVATDGSGKKLDNDVVQIPAGTVITNSDGSTSVLAAPDYYYRERVVNADPTNPLGVATVRSDVSAFPSDFGLTVRLPPYQADLQTLANLLLSIDASLAQLVGAPSSFGSFPSSAQPALPQYAMPAIGIPPSQISPTIPRPVVSDIFGRQVLIPWGSREAVTENTITITSTTSAQNLLVNTDKSIFNDLVVVVLINTSATATEVDLSDGTNTIPLFVPATDMRGFSLGGLIKPQKNTGNTWTATTITSVASVKVWGLFFQNRAS